MLKDYQRGRVVNKSHSATCSRQHQLLWAAVAVAHIMAQGSTWMTDYPDEVLAWMRQREAQHLPYHGNSPQLSMRRALVEFICMVTERLRLSVATTHLAVYLLDRFMDAHFISDNQLHLTALTGIMLAAKFEEKDMNIPRIPELNAFTHNKYSMSIFNSMEAFVLKFFNWNVGTVTVAHFAEFFLMRGVSASDTLDGASITVPVHTRNTLWRTTALFLDISLHDQVFLQWASSQVAAACVACGRVCCNLLPTWPMVLQTTTGYPLHALSHLMDLFLRLYKSEKLGTVCGTPESGYGSQCPSLQGSP